MIDKPKVSVIIPSHNSAKYISNALLSVQLQDYINLEIVVIDDCSTDNTQQVIETFCTADDRIKLQRLSQNSGPAIARNVGIELSSGEYIAFLDADDEWLPGRITRQITLFNSIEDMDLLFTDVKIIDKLNRTSKPYSEINKIQKRELLSNELFEYKNLFKVLDPCKRQLYSGNFICISSVMVKRSLVNEVNGFDPTRFGTEDIDLWIRLSHFGAFYYLHEITANYNWLDTSLSRINDIRLQEMLRFYTSILTNPAYEGMHDITRRNLVDTYKSMIIDHASHWRIMKAWITYFKSRKIISNSKLLIYALVSFFGPIPVFIKTKILNPLLVKYH